MPGLPPSVQLLPGANLVVWPGADVALANLSLPAGVRTIYWYNAPQAGWLRHVPSAPAYVSNLPTLRRGEAYWFLVTQALEVHPAH